ncbi:MAG TPA: peptidoglycan bridge formation glycyltransferase FemA/FemB family protein, partial [Candidatus Dormibacteraeota bacterium]|nr:peptidoglycan bridge formation glycyltransferase FemA/FemB family protein [Candidatus Dormibacteraeota bacterium]
MSFPRRRLIVTRDVARPTGSTVAGADPAAWNRGLAAVSSPVPLTQSWGWGEVQARAGWHVNALWLPSPVLVLTQGVAPLRWAFVPRGPAGCEARVLEALVDWARANRLARLRVEPELEPSSRRLLETAGFERSADVQPSHTRIMALGSEDDMLASFRRSTRYNIRHAERSGVIVDEGVDAAELARQVHASAARAGINLPGRHHLDLILQAIPDTRTFVASHDGEPLCALMVAVHDRRGYYLFSGSNGRKRNLKAMDLAMWHGIRYAARMGCSDYDMWGIAPDSDPRHPWHGFTEFKRGYGGSEVEYVGTWDLKLSAPAAFAIDLEQRALKTIRRLRRR